MDPQRDQMLIYICNDETIYSILLHDIYHRAHNTQHASTWLVVGSHIVIRVQKLTKVFSNGFAQPEFAALDRRGARRLLPRDRFAHP